MTKFLFVYHTSWKSPTEEELAAAKPGWDNWFDSLGEAVIDAGNPVGNHYTVHRSRMVTSDGGNNPARGYSIIQAESRDDALEIAKTCPLVLDASGDVEVAEITAI